MIQREHRLGARGGDAGTVDAGGGAFAHQSEFNRVPVNARQQLQGPQPLRAQTAHAVGLHEVGHDRIHQHRHMTEYVVKHVRLLQIVELVRLANEVAGGKTALRQVLEKNLVRHQPGHRHHLPSGAPHQHLGKPAEIGNGVSADRQVAHAGHERVAGTARQQARLPLEQRLPHSVFGRGVGLPTLRDGPIGRAHCARISVHRCRVGHWLRQRHGTLHRQSAPGRCRAGSRRRRRGW